MNSKSKAKRAKRPPASNREAPAAKLSTSVLLVAILATRAVLHDQIEISSRSGVVVDSIPLSLFENHRQELAVRYRQLDEAEQAYRACLSRLDAMYPEAQPPAPEPPPPRPAQYFPRISKLLGQRHTPRTSH